MHELIIVQVSSVSLHLNMVVIGLPVNIQSITTTSLVSELNLMLLHCTGEPRQVHV